MTANVLQMGKLYISFFISRDHTKNTTSIPGEIIHKRPWTAGYLEVS